jgi:hypothetical protein
LDLHFLHWTVIRDASGRGDLPHSPQEPRAKVRILLEALQMTRFAPRLRLACC